MKQQGRTATRLATLVLLAALFAAASSCTKKAVIEDGNLMVFHYSLRDDVKTLDPANAYDVYSLDVVANIYETLYQYSYLADGYKIVPLLAADMPRYSADRLTVTIPLKRQVHFQDDAAFKETSGKGRELFAQDFVEAFKRLAVPSLESQGWWIFDGKIKGINEFHDKLLNTPKAGLPKAFAEPIEGIRALDDYTLQLKLIHPYPQLPYVLAMTFSSPVPAEAVAAYGDENGAISDHAIGTGAFVLKSWDRGHQIVLDRNASYHPEFYPVDGSPELRQKGLFADAGKPLPLVDRVVLDVLREAQPAWQGFMKGQHDLIMVPKDSFAEAIAKRNTLSPELVQKGVHLSVQAGSVFYYLSFNMKDKLLGTNRVLRQAISSIIDREKWIELFTNGTGIKAGSPLPPGIPDRPNDEILKYDFNLTRAKDLLKKAGYPDGKGLPTINFDMRGSSHLERKLGEFFTQQFAAAGLKLNVIYNTLPAFLEKAKQSGFQIAYGGWNMDYPDPENVYQLFYGPNQAPGPAEASFNNRELNRLFLQMSGMEPGPKRAAVIGQMDEIIQEEVPWALGFYYTTYELSQPWVLNYRPMEMLPKRFKYYRINKDVKQRYAESR